MIEFRKLRADFNGLFDGLLCLSRSEFAKDDKGCDIKLVEGMCVEAFDDDPDDQGCPDKLIAHAVVFRSPDWLECKGSTWALQIDGDGVRHATDLDAASSRMCCRVAAWLIQVIDP